MGTDARGFPLGDLRVSDAERDRAVSELSDAFQAGRITFEEFDRRSTQALSARTGRQLTATVADLPLDLGPVDDAPAARAARRRGDSYLVPRLSFAASLTAICFASDAVSADSQPGVGWTGALIPAAVSVLCLILVILLRVRAWRAARLPERQPRETFAKSAGRGKQCRGVASPRGEKSAGPAGSTAEGSLAVGGRNRLDLAEQACVRIMGFGL
jgi:hypothetical protein